MRSRLRFGDIFRLGAAGFSARPGRSTLTALGIAIGISAIVSVIGISASGRAELLATIDRLGTNLLRVRAGRGIFGGPGELPLDSPAMAARMGPVQQVTSAALVGVSVRRTDRIPELETGGLGVIAVEPDLAEVVGATLTHGRFLEAGLDQLPVTVLGSVAAERLGIANLDSERLVFLGESWFTVIGILDDLPLHPDLERAALIGQPAARRHLDDGHLGLDTLFVRVHPDAVNDVVEVIPATVNPENPDQVEITRPSDALQAREAAEAALTNLLVGLGAVALLVGGVAIGNVMAISVLERRMEIGVRRALGATRGHVQLQFLTEAVLLGGVGGLAGVGLGSAITVGFATVRDTVVAIPWEALGGAVAAALVIGGLAGLYPAVRAARVAPAEAVRTG